MRQSKSKIDFIAGKNKTKISKTYKTKRIERSNNLVTKVITQSMKFKIKLVNIHAKTSTKQLSKKKTYISLNIEPICISNKYHT
jgi:hypothetical protein